VKPLDIVISEWETLGANNCPDLAGRFLDATPSVQQAVKRIEDNGLLSLTELRQGLRIESNSHVGRIQLGDLHVTILPKVSGPALLKLVRYAYGLRRLHLIAESEHLLGPCGFEDLLITQLNAEVRELITRGLPKEYVPTKERLSRPRGRIDFSRVARDGGVITAALPCLHHPRLEDTILNRVLLAGLHLAGQMASVLELRREARHIASVIDERVTTISFEGDILEKAGRQINRLTAAYGPAISIIQMLAAAHGVEWQGTASLAPLPGFLFDMNRFFQALVSRFLRDNLPGYFVKEEYRLRGMMRFNPRFNPMQRKAPTPRPDYVVMRHGQVCSVLDAKYRDLWEKPLPREMLYQLVVYAVSQNTQRRSSILYPTANTSAKEARIDVSDPVSGTPVGQVSLRPVHLPTITELVTGSGTSTKKAREAYARQLAFGV
jgi:5-methylcytosine-specific restriction enzyme subunit McrC